MQRKICHIGKLHVPAIFLSVSPCNSIYPRSYGNQICLNSWPMQVSYTINLLNSGTSLQLTQNWTFYWISFLNLGCVINSRSNIWFLWFYSDVDIHQEGRGRVVFEIVNKEKCVALLWYYTSRLCNLTLTKKCFDAILITIKNATLI